MSYTRHLLVPTVLVFVVFGASAVRADETRCYTNASLKGTYAAVVTYGANVALALAIRHLDGQGNLTGTFTLNAPDPASTTGGGRSPPVRRWEPTGSIAMARQLSSALLPHRRVS
jgi:hypothetical protein